MTIEITREDLVLLRDCTANVNIKLDCQYALRGDTEALARCAKIIERAKPSAATNASYEGSIRP